MDNCERHSMQLMKTLLTSVILLCLFQPAWADQPVKKSKSSICHRPNTEFYSRTKNFTAYETIEACLASGGRLPKGQSLSPSKSPSVSSKSKELLPSVYDRDHFGYGWNDDDKDCQNTRHELLISSSTIPVTFKDSKKCKVARGRWISMFTGDIITDASKLQIDHVVPLKWAWIHGANSWTRAKRVEFANDPINIIAVEGVLNGSKSDRGPDEWLPPKNQEQYKARFQRVVLKYGLK
ncbi:uncharacterized protein DUF1524 [Marinomonas communis]|uniref:Uncharacterized protein DUF1524 n=1 Tax=Marinomonas communis TaxID=28254 RepID=A0A4R6X319_9GAMM|nr:uncharacterized protein DUF1524 [Marinomonas communis]